jgi:hypothetical protein
MPPAEKRTALVATALITSRVSLAQGKTAFRCNGGQTCHESHGEATTVFYLEERVFAAHYFPFGRAQSPDEDTSSSVSSVAPRQHAEYSYRSSLAPAAVAFDST